MRSATVIEPGGGEVIGDAPDRRVEILCDHEALNATWSRFGPRRDGADLHVHRHHTDLFYVLEGELTVRLGSAGEEVAVAAGTLVRVPPLVVHGFRNGTDRELRYLNLHAPGRGFADYMRGLRDGRTVAFDQEDPPPEGSRPVTDADIGGGELLVDQPGLRVVLLADTPEVAITEAWIDAGQEWSPPEATGRSFESFYVLDGTPALTAGGLRAAAGSWVQMPTGVLSTAGDEPVRVLRVAAGQPRNAGAASPDASGAGASGSPPTLLS